MFNPLYIEAHDEDQPNCWVSQVMHEEDLKEQSKICMTCCVGNCDFSAYHSQCSGNGAGAYNKIRITYTAGHTNFSLNRKAMMGLASAAKIYHEQLVDPYGAEGGIGDPGLSSFNDNGHSETRVKTSLKDTPFGDGPLANFAARQLRHMKIHRPRSLRTNRG